MEIAASSAETDRVYVYGSPPTDLAETPANAVQLSPLAPGSAALEALVEGHAERILVAAPSATLERRYVLALSLRALRPGGSLIALAPKEKGGSRLGAELRAFGCEVEEVGRRHHRICETIRPLDLTGVDIAIAAGAPRVLDGVGGWTQPGLFSWDRPDPGTELLVKTLPPLAGAGADLGCGAGRLAAAVIAYPAVTSLDLYDIDRRAVDLARRNVADPRVMVHWEDARNLTAPTRLDFVVMNPPFHEGSSRMESRSLGQDFIRVSHRMLRKGGTLWMVANRHLPYEGVLSPLFASVEVKAEAAGFKVLAARA